MSDSLYDEFWQNLGHEIERQAQCSHSSIELRGEEFLELQPRCVHRVRRQRIPRHRMVTSATVPHLWVKLGVGWSHRRRAGGDRAWRPRR